MVAKRREVYQYPSEKRRGEAEERTKEVLLSRQYPSSVKNSLSLLQHNAKSLSRRLLIERMIAKDL
jgi:hypothetical protein